MIATGDSFRAAVEPHRRELLVRCYRMLGSVDDAHDLLQETMTRAWRAYPRYDPHRASMRTWLYRIATNACLNALESRRRRPLPSDVGAAFDDPEAADVTALTRLVRHDVVLEMPPMWNRYRGSDAYGAFMARVFRTRGTTWRTVPVASNGQAALAAYRAQPDGPFTLHTLQCSPSTAGRSRGRPCSRTCASSRSSTCPPSFREEPTACRR